MSTQVITVISSFTDVAGKIARSKFNYLTTLSGTAIPLSTVATDAASIVSPIEKASKLKYLNCAIVVPLTLTTSGYKESAVSGSSVFRSGLAEFFSEPGDSQKRTTTRITIPSPKSTVLATGGTKLKTDASLYTDIVDAVKANALSMDGRAIVAAAGTAVKQRVTRK